MERYAQGERDFLGANLVSADLRGADLRGADFRGASFREARLGPPLYAVALRHGALVIAGGMSGLLMVLAGALISVPFEPRFMERNTVFPGLFGVAVFLPANILLVRHGTAAGAIAVAGSVTVAVVAAVTVVVVVSGGFSGSGVPVAAVAGTAAAAVVGAIASAIASASRVSAIAAGAGAAAALAWLIPEDAEPVTGWSSEDAAWLNVISGLRRLLLSG
jgi:hypothetical protein